MEEMTTQSLSKRIEWLDALKGVAIIAVVFGHSLLGYTENNAFGEYNDFFFPIEELDLYMAYAVLYVSKWIFL